MKFLIILSVVGLSLSADPRVEVVTQSRKFTASMFAEVVKADPLKSVVMSGYSTLCPLALLGVASVGDSHDEILSTIGMPSNADIEDGYGYINSELRSLKGSILKLANRVYIPIGQQLNATFASISEDVFNTDVREIDFTATKDAAAAMNAWAASRTDNHITDLVRPSDFGDQTQVVLLNAIYYRGVWDSKFVINNTEYKDFHVTMGKTISVPMMYQHGRFKYAHSEDLSAKLLEMYFDRGEASILFVLPDSIDGFPALADRIVDIARLDKAADLMEELPVDVYIPRITNSYTLDLKQLLEKLGIKKLFTNEAKIDYLIKSARYVHLTGAVQKAFFQIDENGVTSAATSAAGPVGVTSRVRDDYTKQFLADRPFYWTLRSKKVSLMSGVFYE